MEHSSPLIAGVGLADRTRASRWPARLGPTQSVTGLVLVLIMWGHMSRKPRQLVIHRIQRPQRASPGYAG